MKLSNRLLACAGLVCPGNTAADIGTDHGFLPIYLLQNHICPRVIAADLREKPLNAARRNAARAGISENIFFCLSNGLDRIPLDAVQTVICAGMGGDTIMSILDKAMPLPEELQLILQPQTAAPELRRFLGAHGCRIQREWLARDGNFVYTVLEVFPAGGESLSPGACWRPQGETDRTTALYRDYMDRVKSSLARAIAGLRQAKAPDLDRLRYFEAAQAELLELEAEI